MNNYSQLISNIIKEQQVIIGPIAIDQANKVGGLSVANDGRIKVTITGSDTSKILTELVEKYEQLFGRASVEVCRDAVKELKPPIPNDELPQILR